MPTIIRLQQPASSVRSLIQRILPLALVVSVGALSACRAQSADEKARPVERSAEDRKLEGKRVEVVVVQASTPSLTLAAPGEVEGRHDALIASPQGGLIEGVHVKKGQRVKRGQLLVTVDRTLHATRLKRAELELRSAERELARAQALGASIPKAEIDSADDRVSLAEAALKELRLNAQRAVIHAPFDGYVVDVEAERGEVASPGSSLLRLVQINPVHVTVAVSDRDLRLAQPGTRAIIQLDARGERLEGKVAHVSRAADPKTRAFEAVIEVENPEEALLPGMIANVTLHAEPPGDTETPPASDTTESAGGQLLISQDWLVTRPDGVGVFLVQDGKAAWRSVKLGAILRRQVVVEEGLAAGDQLVVVGHRDLVDGERLLIHRTGRCCVDGRAVFGEQ